MICHRDDNAKVCDFLEYTNLVVRDKFASLFFGFGSLLLSIVIDVARCID